MKGIASLAVVCALVGACTGPRSPCASLGASAERGEIESCLAEYQRSGDADVGVAAARALLGLATSGRARPANELLLQAAALAQELERGERRAEALAVRSSVAEERGELTLARELADSQLDYLVANMRASEASRLAHAQAGRRWQAGDTAAAMRSSLLAVAQADDAGDARMQTFARLGLANLYRYHDQLADAERELGRASELARQPSDQAWVAAKQGALYLDRGLDTPAKVHLLRARELMGADQGPLRLSVHLSLAWIYRRSGELTNAAIELVRAFELAPDDVDVWLGRGLLAAAQGDLAAGARWIEGAVARAETDRERWWLSYHAGRLHQQRGDVRTAEAAYQRSIESVRALAAAAGPYIGELAASHRLPYARALGIAARRSDWRAMVTLVLELDELALVAAESIQEDLANAPDPYGASRSGRARGSATTVDDFLAAWRGRALAIVLDDQETVWRLEVRDGKIHGAAQGSAAALDRAADALEADPGARQPARVLSAALAPASWSDAPVYLLTIGPLSRAPLAALDRPAAAPLVRVLSLSPGPAPTLSDSRTIVLGDPRGDLPAARAEAEAVAARQGVKATLGHAVDRRALEAASGAALLHIAAHSTLEATGPALLLADGALFGDAIAAMTPAPRVVVLASCGSAAARDDSRWGSLAGAYLAAGAEVVIASAWTLGDAEAKRFVDELYRHPVATDPVRALAETQAALRGALPLRTLSAFTAIAAPPPRAAPSALAAQRDRPSALR